jgi:predicted PurR-regulated permease PerM
VQQVISTSFKTSSLVVAGTLVLVVAALYLARAVLVPVALAMLLTFLLSPCDRWLRRRGLGRGLSVAVLGVFTFAAVCMITWAISVQARGFAADLPTYQENIKTRVADLQIGKGTALDNVRTAFEQALGEVSATAPARQAAKPMVVTVQGGRFSSDAWLLVLPLVESLIHVLFVVMLVIFMLLEREELRKRVIRLLGYGRLSMTTQALDDAGERVSQYLLAQFIVNAALGLAIGVGLYLLGVPYALLWGLLVVALRFIPYLGIWIALILPFAVSLATSTNWWQPLSVLALFAVLEPVVGMVVEPMLFSQYAGTSKLAMLIAIAFWTWLWGPIGMLLATPLTACLSVLAKNVPQLQFIDVLFGDEPVMQTSVNFYKRLVAMDQDEAEAIVEDYVRTHAIEHVFDEVLLPALHYAKRDARLGVLMDREQAFVYAATRQIVERIGHPPTFPALATTAAVAEAGGDAATTMPVQPAMIRILAWPSRDEADAIALLMLQQLLDPARYDMEIADAGQALPVILRKVESENPEILCIGYIPPGGLSATRHISKLLRQRLPDLDIVVGYWGSPEKAHHDRDALVASGVTHCTATLIETRDQIAHTTHPHVKLSPAAA